MRQKLLKTNRNGNLNNINLLKHVDLVVIRSVKLTFVLTGVWCDPFYHENILGFLEGVCLCQTLMAKSSWWSSPLPPTSQSFDLFPWSLHVCVGLCPGATSVSLLSIVTVFGDWCDWMVELDAKWLNPHSALISSLLAVSSWHHSSFLLNFFAAAVIPHSNLDEKILKQSLKGFEDILGRIHEESCRRSDSPLAPPLCLVRKVDTDTNILL